MTTAVDARLLLDQMLAPIATRDLKDQFTEIRHVREFQLDRTEDAVIRNFARRQGYAIVTKDFDYLDLLHQSGHPPKIVFLRFGNCSNAVLTRTLRAYAEAIGALVSGDDGLLDIPFPAPA